MSHNTPRLTLLTDGKIGDDVQCLGLAEAMGLLPKIHHVAPRRPWVWGMPWGPADPRDRLTPPWPDMLIATGRRSIPYVRHVKRASKGKTFTVILKDPRTGANAADLIWVPEHDRLRGENVIVTLTSPHRITAEKLAAQRGHPLGDRPSPRIAVLIGGATAQARWTYADVTRLAHQLDQLTSQGATLLGTFSRRTPPEMKQRLAPIFSRGRNWLWDETSDNPYLALLAHADSIIVTADSVNMVGEAVSTGTPVLVFEPASLSAKIRLFLDRLKGLNAVACFTGALVPLTYAPINSTPVLAQEIMRRYHIFRTQDGS